MDDEPTGFEAEPMIPVVGRALAERDMEGLRVAMAELGRQCERFNRMMVEALRPAAVEFGRALEEIRARQAARPTAITREHLTQMTVPDA